MLDIYEIEDTIEKFEAQGQSLYTCERLAWLYIVRDNYYKTAAGNKEKPLIVQSNRFSEFMETVNGCDYNRVLEVMDEHVEALKAVYPKEYDAVISKLRMV